MYGKFAKRAANSTIRPRSTYKAAGLRGCVATDITYNFITNSQSKVLTKIFYE
jgi:hypothetical protein